MRARPTIKDIAAEVGVSHTTVSYILSGNTTQKISPATRKAVLDAAKRLQYVPNSAARSLRNNSTHCVSVAMEKALTNTRFSGLLQGIRESLQAEGYWIMLFDFSTSSPPEEHCRQMIIDNTLPFVACDCCPEEPELVSVSFDYERGAFEVACRLFGEGARRILYWRPDVQSLQEGYREQGLRRAAELYQGVEFSVSLLPSNTCVCTSDRHSDLNRICSQHLAQEILPRIADFQPGDAVVCCWSVMVNHLNAALSGKGRGLKIATLSDAEPPVVTDTQILTSRSNFVRGGKECTALLLRQLRGDSCSSVVLPPDIPSYINS